MVEDSVFYKQDIARYICLTQQVFSICLFLLFVLHIIILQVFGFSKCSEFQYAVGFSALQAVFFLLAYAMFRYYFKQHLKYVAIAAYLNIFQTMLFLEIYHYFFDEYISYTIVICILVCTSLTIIGHIRKYTALLSAMLVMSMSITVIKNMDLYGTQEMQLYFIDNLFILIIVVGINICISYLKYRDFENKQQIIHLSERDALTGLLNRKALESAVKKQYASDGICAMVLLDLDNFKMLNDTLGHYEGDRCLCLVADKLNNIFHDLAYVSRLGGDEFVVFLPDVASKDFVLEQAQKILQDIPHKYTYETKEICITCSVGVSFLRQDSTDLYETLYKAADSAMYDSKTSGKNKVTVFS